MSSTASPAEVLPAHWIDQLFRKLSIRYGRPFMARWDGIDEAEAFRWLPPGEALALELNHPTRTLLIEAIERDMIPHAHP